jgi:hypothetical protein
VLHFNTQSGQFIYNEFYTVFVKAELNISKKDRTVKLFVLLRISYFRGVQPQGRTVTAVICGLHCGTSFISPFRCIILRLPLDSTIYRLKV